MLHNEKIKLNQHFALLMNSPEISSKAVPCRHLLPGKNKRLAHGGSCFTGSACVPHTFIFIQRFKGYSSRRHLRFLFLIGDSHAPESPSMTG